MFALFLYQIERWWRELHERLEKFFKFPLKELQDQGHYDTNSETDWYYLYLNSFESHTILLVVCTQMHCQNQINMLMLNYLCSVLLGWESSNL